MVNNVFKKIKDWLTRKNEPQQLNINVKVTGMLKLHWADALQISQNTTGIQNPEPRGQGFSSSTQDSRRPEPSFEIPTNIQLPSVKFGKDSE